MKIYNKSKLQHSLPIVYLQPIRLTLTLKILCLLLL
jgi:hypothetical protein